MDIPYLPGLPFMGKTGCGPVGNESKRFTKQLPTASARLAAVSLAPD
ncbi:MAG TPA: hypothetical protein VFA06_10115 [Actinocrinis sp.]|jgi:hypothetical protein|nr:hypothetical protein [Actinocrinis sp.]HZU56210.1 hypothetical protein [Actinocrinis sp.]